MVSQFVHQNRIKEDDPIRLLSCLMTLIIIVSPVGISQPQFESMDIPAEVDTSFKCYMDYRTLTSTTSDQWALQQYAYTDSNGFRRFGGDYMIAVGTHYAQYCGQRFLITLDDVVITAIVADIKGDGDTNSTNQYTELSDTSGNLIEFIVDVDVLPREIRFIGDVSLLGLEGEVQQMIPIGEININDLN